MDNRRDRLEKNLKIVVYSIGQKYRPEKMVLFGSLANGKIREGSDIDLLIVKKTKKRSVERIGEVLSLCKYNIAFEPLILTPKEIEQRLNNGDGFLEEVLENGRVVYELG